MKIIIYTKKRCPWCEEVLHFFKKNNVKFEERDVQYSEEYFKELVKKSGQDITPTLEIDGKIVAVDSDVNVISKILKKMGAIN